METRELLRIVSKLLHVYSSFAWDDWQKNNGKKWDLIKPLALRVGRPALIKMAETDQQVLDQLCGDIRAGLDELSAITDQDLLLSFWAEARKEPCLQRFAYLRQALIFLRKELLIVSLKDAAEFVAKWSDGEDELLYRLERSLTMLSRQTRFSKREQRKLWAVIEDTAALLQLISDLIERGRLDFALLERLAAPLSDEDECDSASEELEAELEEAAIETAPLSIAALPEHIITVESLLCEDAAQFFELLK